MLTAIKQTKLQTLWDYDPYEAKQRRKTTWSSLSANAHAKLLFRDEDL